MTREELLDRSSSRELTGWQAFERVEGPLGPRRLDLLVAMLTAAVANTVPRQGRAFQPKDFYPQWDRPTEPKDPEALLRTVERLNAALGGRDLRPKD